MKLSIVAVCLLAGLLLGLQARSQIGRVEFRSPTSDSVKVVDILSDESYHFQQIDSVTSITTLVGHVKIKQEKTIIDCDSLIMNPHENFIECFGHVHINDNDSTNIYSDYMKYLVDKKNVHFLKNVKLTDGKGILTTEDLTYDLNTKIGTYDHGGKIVNKESVLTSEQGIYYEVTKDVHFRNHVVLKDPRYDMTADSLLYNTQTQISTFITETYILFKDSTHRSVRTRSGFYDLKNKRAEFGQGPIIKDGSQTLVGDSVRIDDSTGISTAVGHAIYIDTAQGVRLVAGYMINNKKKNSFLATRNPVMILKQDKDSIYVYADTLASGRLVDMEAEMRMQAIQDSLHRIFIDSVQKAQADSLHRRAVADSASRAQDTTLRSIGDSTHRIVVQDKSDSVRTSADSTGQRTGIDSLRAKGTDSLKAKGADSTKAPPLTRRQQRKLEKAQHRAERAAVKAARKAEKEKIRAAADSVRKAAAMAADSARKAVAAEKARIRARADSLRADSLQRIADSVRHIREDSLRQHGLLDTTTKVRTGDSAAAARKAADSAKLAVVPITDTSLRYIKGYHHVRIFSDSLQAVSDSLYYSAKDSIFRLYYDPIAWGSGNYQVTGDTMFVFTKNKKASRLYVFENALTINKVARNFYNQLKGTTINVYFQDGEIDFVRAKGNAESIYYIKDDSNAYTGVNKAHADIIDMVFAPKDTVGVAKPVVGKDTARKDPTEKGGRELYKVILRSDGAGSMIPIKKVPNFDDMRLRGFKWQEDRRPKSKEELFRPPPKKKGEEEDEEEAPQKKPDAKADLKRTARQEPRGSRQGA